ncbi:hypothetical protein LINPERPRIM_LOCUS39017 [Linum perenne]
MFLDPRPIRPLRRRLRLPE